MLKKNKYLLIFTLLFWFANILNLFVALIYNFRLKFLRIFIDANYIINLGSIITIFYSNNTQYQLDEPEHNCIEQT